jgi:hypothetical protein
MPLQKRKKKKPASDKSVKQVVSQVVKVNIGDTKPKKKRRKRKSSGGAAPSAAPPPMLAQVPQQQFIYSPPPPIPQEPLAPPRQSAPSVEVADPFPVSALNRVLGSMPRSTLAVPQEVPRPTLQRSISEQPRPASINVPVPPDQPVPPEKPPEKPVSADKPPPIQVAKRRVVGSDILPIGARDAVPEASAAPTPTSNMLKRDPQKPTIGDGPQIATQPAEYAYRIAVEASEKHKVERETMGSRYRGRSIGKSKGRKSKFEVVDPKQATLLGFVQSAAD